MFGREPHSREAYDDLDQQTSEADNVASKNRGKTTLEQRARFDEPHPVFHPSSEQERFLRLKSKLEKMKAAGHSEALALEEKHNTLLTKMQEAQRALDAFENHQLGRLRE